MANKTLRKLLSLALSAAVAVNISGAALAASIADKDTEREKEFADEKLQDAIDYAEKSVTLTSDETANVTIDKDITLDLDGYTLSGDEDKKESVITVKDGAEVTITSSATETDEAGYETTVNGTITGGNAYSGGGIKVIKSDVTVENVTITGNTATNSATNTGGGGIYVSEGEATVQNVTITGNTAQNGGGGGILVDRSDVTVENVTITDNTAKNGGGISVYNGTLEVKDSVISENTAQKGSQGDGGGIHVTGNSYYGGSSVTITDTEITNNTAAYYGGGVYSDATGKDDSDSAVTITGSTISGNTANCGGGIANGSDMTIQESEITENAANHTLLTYAGGGIYAFNGTTTITDTTITENTAATGGGGIGVNDADVTITGGSLYGNTADKVGNDLTVIGSPSSSVTISDVEGMDKESDDYRYQAGYVDGGVWGAFNVNPFIPRFNVDSKQTPKVLTGSAAVTSGAVYTVTYVDGNGNQYDGGKYVADGEHTVLGGAEDAEFARDGFTFTGWVDSEGKPVDGNSPLKMTGDVTLIAQWKENTPSGGGGGGSDPDPDPDPDPELPDPDVPLTDLPEEEVPLEEAPEEEIPLEELPEEEVPLSEIPQTGDMSALWALTLAASGLALAWVLCSNKKREQEI